MNPRFRQFLRQSWYRLWAVVAVFVICLALGFSALRVLLPFAPGYKTELEQLAGRLLDKTVTINRIETDWARFRPRVKLIDVSIHDASRETPLIHAEQIILGMNPLKSAINRRIEIDDIVVVGMHLSVLRDAQGRVWLNDVLAFAGGNDAPLDIAALKPPEQLLHRNIRLAGGRLDYRDDILGLDYTFDTVNLAFRLAGESSEIFLGVNLPPAYGESLEIGLEVRGRLAELDAIKGRAFVRGKALNIPAWMTRFNKPGYIHEGIVSFDAWVDITDIWAMTGNIDIQKPALDLQKISGDKASDPVWVLDGFSSDFRIVRSGSAARLDLQNTRVNDGGIAWPETGLNLEVQNTADKKIGKLKLGMDFVNINRLLPLLRMSPAVREQADRIGLTGIEGDFSGVYANLDLMQAEPRVDFRADFSELGLQGRGKLPSVAGIKGELRISAGSAQITLDTANAELAYPEYFRQPLTVSLLKGRMSGKFADGEFSLAARDLRLETPHIRSRVWFDIAVDEEQAPHAKTYAVYEDGQLSATPLYLPVSVMPEKAIDWLDHAFVSGTVAGDLEIDGPLKKFPFRNNEGLFRIDLEGRDAVVNYFEDYPQGTIVLGQMNLTGVTLSVAVHEAWIYESHIGNFTAYIPDMQNTSLEIYGQSYGPTADLVKYVRSSNLRKTFEVVIDQVAATGLQASDMYLYFPISESVRASHEAAYRFSTSAYQTGLDFQNWGMTLTGINQRFYYSNEEVSAEPFDAVLNGHAIVVGVSSEDTGAATRITMKLDGRTDINDLLRKHYPQGLIYAAGEADYTAEVRLYMNSDAGDAPSPSLHVRSDLRDVELNLPPPLTKAAGKSVPFDLFVRFYKDSPAIASLAYSDWLRGSLALTTDGALDIQRADVRLDSPVTPRLPEQPGIVMRGRLTELNIDRWRNLKWPYGKEGNSLIDKLQFAELDINRMTYLRRTVNQVDLQVTQQLHNWQFVVDSLLLRGEVLAPIEGFEKRGLAINLKYFDFDQVNVGIDGEAPSPHDVPPFQLSAERMILNGWRLDNLKMLAAPVERGIRFHTIRIEDPAVGLQGEGEWLLDAARRHKSSVKLRFDSNNIGKGLENFGYARMIQGGRGTAEFDIGWAASPSGFSFALLQGSARIAVNDGQILDLEPGGGRLLGLLSLQTIPRRLALDFKDIFAKGFRFDKMRGSFSFEGGDAYTRDYYIDGPVGRIDIAGRTGLEARDYDQQVMFRPDLSSSLPLVGTLLGGTTAGIAVILVDRIARVFGKQTDDLGRVEYHLTGAWDAPQLTPVNRQNGKDKPKAATAEQEKDQLPEITVEGG